MLCIQLNITYDVGVKRYFAPNDTGLLQISDLLTLISYILFYKLTFLSRSCAVPTTAPAIIIRKKTIHGRAVITTCCMFSGDSYNTGSRPPILLTA